MRFSDFVQWWRQSWASHFGQSVITKPGDGQNTYDVVLMAGQDGNEPIQLTRLEQFGDVTQPPSKRGSCVYWRLADGGVVMSLGDAASRPTDGKPGDRGLYSNQAGTRVHLYGAASTEPGKILITNASGAKIVLRADGTVEINSATSKKIVLNNGTKENARNGDGMWAGDIRVEAETDGMSKDTLKAYFVTRDPEDPSFPLDQQLIEWTGALGSAVMPAPGNQITVELRGVITRGRDSVVS